MFKSTTNRHQDALNALFKHKRVARLSELRKALRVRSRTTVFFALKRVGYYSSYSHAGRYYTLADIPRFDDHGLWSHGEVRFSKHGTLRDTVVALVQQAPGGHSHEQLQVILGVRVHDTLRHLFAADLLGRERLGAVFVYLSADGERAAEQLRYREETDRAIAEMLRVATDEEVVEVLVEALKEAPEIPVPELVARRLVARGIRLEPHHVVQVYEEHGLVPGKKTARHSSGPYRR
jgi:hypothetical protein